MHVLLVILKVMLAAFAIAMVSKTVYGERKNLGFIFKIYSRFRVLMFLKVLAILFFTIASFLVIRNIPYFNYGWMDLFLKGGGNLLIAPVMEASDASSIWIKIVPFGFLSLLLIALPYLAHYEEKEFRKGRVAWSDITKKSIEFGLVHCIVGIPLAAGVALIGTGFFYAWTYRQGFLKEMAAHGNKEQAEEEAVLTSTAYHTLYNTVLILLAAMIAVAKF